jgi:hypothetical protein
MKIALFSALAGLTAGVLTLFPSARAADHGDAPALAQDLGADIADVFAFQDPNDNSQTVLIATIHGFLVPGEVSNFAVFDETIRYRFEIYNDHVNEASSPFLTGGTAAQKKSFLARVKPARTIDVTFSKRGVGPNAQTGTGGSPIPMNFRRPLAQQATLTLTGFSGANALRGKGVFTQDTNDPSNPANLTVTPFGVGAMPPPNSGPTPGILVHQIDNVLASTGGTNPSIKFFAGEMSDPFFFDVPAFSAFLDSLRAGTPNPGVFSRARNTFAGYNVLAIAIEIPKSLLVNSDLTKTFIGIDFLTQRHVTKLTTNNGAAGVGAFKTVDRMGNPTVNVALVPFDLKNSYNAGTPHDDVQLKFAGPITQTLNDLGVDASHQGDLASIAIARGDLLHLNTSTPNDGTSTSAAVFPNGRRLQDDTVDIVLTTINNGIPVSDGISRADTDLTGTFPFLGLPHQPFPNGTTDDATRN